MFGNFETLNNTSETRYKQKRGPTQLTYMKLTFTSI